MSPESFPHNLQDWLLIIGFILTWGGILLGYVFSKGKQEGTEKAMRKQLKDEIARIEKDQTAAIESIRSSQEKMFEGISEEIKTIHQYFKNDHGEPYYLSVQRHTEDCAKTQKTNSAQYKDIKGQLRDMKVHLAYISDIVMMMATSQGMRVSRPKLTPHIYEDSDETQN